ncbi:hypothetical protein SKAU_G00036640 [Synaphobranchus kaupii]|uniref:Kv channel-interacting protein 4 n=1 Tax=Synaphobranchus kaupii TaxID=118154 RepID=A0A9Q1JDQ0_SYNKA|nr:hypothetical protein SKAU_G00036640 [Synaphobranchus kaupii]
MAAECYRDLADDEALSIFRAVGIKSGCENALQTDRKVSGGESQAARSLLQDVGSAERPSVTHNACASSPCASVSDSAAGPFSGSPVTPGGGPVHAPVILGGGGGEEGRGPWALAQSLSGVAPEVGVGVEVEWEGRNSSGGSGDRDASHPGTMLSAVWETEGLQTVGIVVIVCASLKLLHLLGLINFSEDSVEDELEMSTVRYRPEGLEQLEAQTRFSRKELQILYRGFKNECPSGVVNEDNFKVIYSQFFPQGDASTYAHFLFNAFDTDHNGSVSFEDFVMGLSILLRGSVQEKLNWAFNLYDINKDGYITKEEMLDIMKAIYDMMGKCTYPILKEEAPRQHVEIFFQKMDKNRDGVVTIDEFIDCCQNDENIMRSMQLFENVI